MPELIDRQAALEIAMCYCPDDDGCCSKAGNDLREMLDEIEALPTIEPEVRHGRWMFIEQKSDYLWKCSNCKGNFDQRFSYCPHCGAKMDGGAENG